MKFRLDFNNGDGNYSHEEYVTVATGEAMCIWLQGYLKAGSYSLCGIEIVEGNE
tara:strand:- start:235 stop:396 length:162 start_codon:yes stop_codon:yes gene_type:complete